MERIATSPAEVFAEDELRNGMLLEMTLQGGDLSLKVNDRDAMRFAFATSASISRLAIRGRGPQLFLKTLTIRQD